MSDKPIEGVDVVISYRIAQNYIHADYHLYKDGEHIGKSKSSASWMGQINTGSFVIGNFPMYIASEDKKLSRGGTLLMDNCPSPKDITFDDGTIEFHPWIFKTKGGHNCALESEVAKIRSVKAIPLHVCPKCGRERYRKDDPYLTRDVSMEYPSMTWDVLYQFSRCEDCRKIKYRRGVKLATTAFISACGSYGGHPGYNGWYGFANNCKLRGNAKDPRAFLYERPVKISKQTITKKVIGHLRRVLKIRPLNNSERDFFKLIIGAGQLAKLA